MANALIFCKLHAQISDSEKMGRKILVWFRNDLRLHDNGVLVEAIAKSDEILLVYVFDPRQFEQTPYYSLKTGTTRTKFLIESVASLKKSFQALNGDLLVLVGLPEEIIPELVEKYEIAEVYHHREVASEETRVSTAVEDALWKLRVNLKHFIGHTLYNKEDLPFPIKDIPDVFSQFKKKTERDALVKPCFETPTNISFSKVEDWGTIPTVNDLLPDEKSESINEFLGGEDEALAHLHNYLHAGEGIVLANAILKKHEIVSKLSAWLALGCLSPREVYWKMKDAELQYGVRPYFHQIVLGLLWRDYYRFMFKKYGNTYFQIKGFKSDALPAGDVNLKMFDKWRQGKTGHEEVDGFMKTLNSTGYINQVARQLVATYLVKELAVSWVYGAAHFEEKLIDYSPASNWGNWASVAGVGNDQKLSNSFEFAKILKLLVRKTSIGEVVKV